MLIGWDPPAAGQTVELPQGEILASVRLRAMGGAVTGIAESASAQLYNPAAMAIRRPLQPAPRVDLDLALQARDHPVLTAAFAALGAQPRPWPAERAWWQLGSDLRVGPAAIGAQLRNQSWDDGAHRYAAATVALGAGYAWPTLAVGALPELVVWQGAGRRTTGWGGVFGALLAPDGLPLRLGSGYQGATRTGLAAGPGPDGLRVPAEGSLGASWSIGATNQASPLGPQRIQRKDDGPMLLLATDLVVTQDARGAVPILPVLTEDPIVAAGWTLGLRSGAEAWLAHHHARIRGGFTSIPGRGERPAEWLLTAGTSVQIARDPRGIPIRATIGGEGGGNGISFGLGIETW